MMTSEELRREYEYRYNNVLKKFVPELEIFVREQVNDYPRIERIIARAKSIDSFIKKSKEIENGRNKYSDPMNQIQDQLGARIITHYITDVEEINKRIIRYFSPIEEKIIIPDSVKEFDYEGKHYILFIPLDLKTNEFPKEHLPTFFELQVKTLFQHAWAEADHDLAYKPSIELSRIQKRKVAFTAAQAWGADYIFNELASELDTITTNS